MTCHVATCGQTEGLIPYLVGDACLLHTPAALAGRSEPSGGCRGDWIEGTRPTPLFTALDFGLKKYVSKQRAVKIAAERDAVRAAS